MLPPEKSTLEACCNAHNSSCHSSHLDGHLEGFRMLQCRLATISLCYCLFETANRKSCGWEFHEFPWNDGFSTCFRITIAPGRTVSVAVPLDCNHIGRASVAEMCIVENKDGPIVYTDKLGFSRDWLPRYSTDGSNDDLFAHLMKLTNATSQEWDEAINQKCDNTDEECDGTDQETPSKNQPMVPVKSWAQIVTQ